MDFGAVAFKPHFIHELIDEIDPAAMVGVDIFAAEWVGNFGWFKAWPGIANDDQQAVFFIAGHATLYFLCWVILAAMKNGVCESFAKCSFDLEFLARSAVHAASHFHNALDHGTDGGRVGVERNLNTDHKFVAIKL